MTTLNTIIEEEKKKARKQFDDSPVSLRIDALERYAHVHGWSQFEGRTIQDEIDTIVTTAMQRAWKDSRIDWLRSEIEKLEGVKRDLKCDELPECSKPHIHERDACYNTALTSIITRYKEELLELEKGV